MITSGAFVDVLVGYAVAMATSYRLKVWVDTVCLVSPADTVTVQINNTSCSISNNIGT